MFFRIVAAGILLGSTALAIEGAPNRTERKQGQTEGVIDPKADAQLRKMSDYMSGLKSFRVETTTIDEKVATDGEKIQGLRESTLTVKRPDGVMIDRLGPAGHVMFRYDGKQFSVALPERNEYGTAPAPNTIDGAVDAARDRLHVDAPGGDLIVSNPYRDLTDGVIEARYIGREPVGKVMAHHLAATKKDVDFQVWIADGAQPVPLRYVITDKQLPGRPQFTVELRHWEPDIPVSSEAFSFMPAPGAKRIELAPKKQEEQGESK